MKLATIFFLGSAALFTADMVDARDERQARETQGVKKERYQPPKREEKHANHGRERHGEDSRHHHRDGRDQRDDDRARRHRDHGRRDYVHRDRGEHRPDDRRRDHHRDERHHRDRGAPIQYHHRDLPRRHIHLPVRTVHREHYVRHRHVHVDNFWNGVFLGVVVHAAFHDGAFCRDHRHRHYREYYYWMDDFGDCYRVEPGPHRDLFVEVPRYQCY